MSSHNVRYHMSDQDPARVSKVDGEVLDDIEEWGAHYIVEIDENESRKIPRPVHVGQRIEVSVAPSGADNCDFRIIDGSDLEEGTDDQILTIGPAWFVLESFWVVDHPRWFVTYSKGSVTVQAA